MDTRVDSHNQLTGDMPAAPIPSRRKFSVDSNLAEATDGLKRRAPQYSAATPMYVWQKLLLLSVLLSIIGGLTLSPIHAIPILFAVLSIPFFFVVLIRIVALGQAGWLAEPHKAERSANAGALTDRDEDLPTYAILVPLFREAHVVPGLIEALTAIDYPTEKLQIALIVETADKETPAALRCISLPQHMRIVTVPEGQPQTKPRALNYALQSTSGEYVVVYDAEDLPDRDQLRCAVAVLRSAPAQLGCVQARLTIDNTKKSWLTRGIMAETPPICVLAPLALSDDSDARAKVACCYSLIRMPRCRRQRD